MVAASDAMGTVLVQDHADKLLDFSQKQIDIALLDSVVSCMHYGQGPQQRAAQDILTRLKTHPDAWTRVDAILEYSQNSITKYFALQILENLINTRWKALPRDQCEGIKKYIVGLVIKTSSDANLAENDRVFLNKLNMVLVQIVKREWPKNWPTFISEIVGASRTNESLCQNNMLVLKLLSEEVFDFSQGQMTQAKANYLKQQFCGEFQAVFQLCQFVLESSQNAPLVEQTLETLLKFLNWIPLGYIFETQLINALVTKFLDVPLFRNVTLQCLTEISSVQIPESSKNIYDRQLLTLFMATMVQLKFMLPPDTDIRIAYAGGNDKAQKFVANLALFLSSFMKEHWDLLEKDVTETDKGMNKDGHKVALDYLLAISMVDDVEIFKICLEYWNWLSAELYRECPFLVTSSYGQFEQLRAEILGHASEIPARRKLYNAHLSELRYVMIGRMAKPEEVLVVENEQGEIVREAIKDTDAINLYKTMRETLVYLTHLDYMDTERIMTEKLQNQVNGTEWGWKQLNTLCWAIGSISGAMMEEDEKRFLVTVIRDLLALCEQKRGKDNKAVIASNIMYVVGQYPRFLRAHWKFLKTVVNKLFEFMHETHEGVQDMACDTFIKIAHKCRRHFVIYQIGETQPFIDEILTNLSMIICDLEPGQVQVFYEAVGLLISAQWDKPVQDMLIEKLMALPNNVWDDVIQSASANVELLKEQHIVKNLSNILKTNISACKSIGHAFIIQLGKIYLDMLNVYKVMSENISAAVALNGESVLRQPLLRQMRGVKTETLRLISTWVMHCEDTSILQDSFVPPLFEAVLFDYQRNVPLAREPEVLATITAIVNKLESHVTPSIPRILDAVFQCTLDMINQNFEEFPEHRTNFFTMLHSINDHCFDAFLTIPPAQFRLVLDSIIWSFKHSMRNVAEIGLEILHRLLQNVANKTADSVSQSFYETYYLMLLEHILSVVTDSSMAQVAGLTLYATILAYMFHLVESGKVSVPLCPAHQSGHQSNMDFVAEYVGQLLMKAFPHLTSDQIRMTVKGFYSYDTDVVKFVEHLRDFLVQIKEFTGEDTSDLFLEEKDRELQMVQETKQKIAASVPGLLNPHEINVDGDISEL